MGVHESRGNLNKAIKELMLRWSEARAAWDDVRAEEFEKQYLQQLEADLKMTGNAMDQMGILLHQVRRDCE
jgi:hypothetical protein